MKTELIREWFFVGPRYITGPNYNNGEFILFEVTQIWVPKNSQNCRLVRYKSSKWPRKTTVTESVFADRVLRPATKEEVEKFRKKGIVHVAMEDLGPQFAEVIERVIRKEQKKNAKPVSKKLKTRKEGVVTNVKASEQDPDASKKSEKNLFDSFLY